MPRYRWRTGKGLVRRAANVEEAAEMMKLEDGGKALAETLEAYTAVANGGGADEFGKTVFPAKNFRADGTLCESEPDPGWPGKMP